MSLRKKILIINLSLFAFAGALMSADTTNMGSLPEPLTLDDALSYALKHNPQLRIVKEELKEKKGLLVQSTSGFLPSIVASGKGNEVQRDTQANSGFPSQGGSIGAPI